MLSEEQALRKCADLCSLSEHCVSEIREKLTKYEIEKPVADKIIDYLIKNKYIDESRYANIYVRDKARFNGWGPSKIRFMLSQKQISNEIITEALANFDVGEFDEHIERLLRNKIKTSHYTDNQKLKAALFRLGASRGYDFQTISRMIKKILSSVDDND